MKKSGNEKSQRFIPKSYNSDFFKLNLRRFKIYIQQFLCFCERQSKHSKNLCVLITF